MTANGDIVTPWDEEKLAVTVENVFELIVGFAEGTSIIEGPSFLVCVTNIKDYIDKIYEIFLLYEIEFSKYQGFNFEKFEE